MPVERVYARPDVASVSLRRSPIVCCLKQADHAVPLHRVLLPAQAELGAR